MNLVNQITIDLAVIDWGDLGLMYFTDIIHKIKVQSYCGLIYDSQIHSGQIYRGQTNDEQTQILNTHIDQTQGGQYIIKNKSALEGANWAEVSDRPCWQTRY